MRQFVPAMIDGSASAACKGQACILHSIAKKIRLSGASGDERDSWAWCATVLAASPAACRRLYLERQVMARQSSRSRSVEPHRSEVGMQRFFTPTNLDRYRKLASGTVNDPEWKQIMGELAKEMTEFRCEARGVAAAGRRLLDDTGSKVV